jgi:hypothetical protein
MDIRIIINNNNASIGLHVYLDKSPLLQTDSWAGGFSHLEMINGVMPQRNEEHNMHADNTPLTLPVNSKCIRNKT